MKDENLDIIAQEESEVIVEELVREEEMASGIDHEAPTDEVIEI